MFLQEFHLQAVLLSVAAAKRQGDGSPHQLAFVCDRVKFRDDEDLQVLTASRQSGGERSVSTILYLISIQVRRPCHALAKSFAELKSVSSYCIDTQYGVHAGCDSLSVSGRR